jgi:hypothetical protein
MWRVLARLCVTAMGLVYLVPTARRRVNGRNPESNVKTQPRAWGRRDSAAGSGLPYSAVVLSSAPEVHRLGETVRRLMPARETLIEPGFFLGSLSEKWMPRVVVVRRGDAISGVLYAKERRIAGRSTGIVYADGRLGNMVVADAVDQEEVLAVAIQTLFASPWVRGVRLAVPPDGFELRAVRTIQSLLPVDVGYAPTDVHVRLRLPRHYEAFLETMGYKSRRNFRYYRRKSDTAGHTYVAKLSQDELVHAALALRAKSRIHCAEDQIKDALQMVAATSRPLAVGLKDGNGAWLSVAGGWYSSDCAMMIFQLNDDKHYGGASLSVVLRAHLIEMLIGEGTQELVFLNGSAPPLNRYALHDPALAVYLDRATSGWRLIRSLVAQSEPWMPKGVAGAVGWIARPKLRANPQTSQEMTPADAAEPHSAE